MPGPKTAIHLAALVVALLAISGCGALRAKRMQSRLQSALPTCRVEADSHHVYVGCDGDVVGNKARELVTASCGEIREIGMNLASVQVAGSSGVTTWRWHPSDGDTCQLQPGL